MVVERTAGVSPCTLFAREFVTKLIAKPGSDCEYTYLVWAEREQQRDLTVLELQLL